MIYVNDTPTNIDISASLALLSEQRLKQMAQFKFEKERQLCVAAYLLLRQGLREEYGITDKPVFGFMEGGKPFLIEYPSIHFNISHCKNAVVCALESHPIGIDVEEICSYEEDVKRFAMNDMELQQINEAADPDVEFAKYWTMKESFLKLTGEGLRDDLKTVFPNEAKYSTVVNAQGGYVYSVCCW